MKLVESNKEGFVFEFGKRERQLFTAILHMYPLLNPDYHQISKSGANSRQIQESQLLLHDAMSEQREAYRKLVAEFLADGNWEKKSAEVFRLKVTIEKTDWLLQVLNDVRVGSWVKLGKPDPQRGDKVEPNAENVQYLGAMELSGLFQTILLQALER